MRYSVLFTTIFGLLVIGCAPKLPENAAQLFEAWFIEPTRAGREAVEELALSQPVIDSLVRLIRSKPIPTGKATAEIRDERQVPYVIGYQTPESFSHDSVYPLILYLHGGIGTRKNTKGEKAYEMLSALGDSQSLFLASPSGNRDAPWWSDAGLKRILQTLRFMSLHFPVDREKVFLAGVSDGATGCYAAANTIGSPFAGFFAVSGFGGMLPRLGMQLHPTNLMQRPIYNVNAGKDRLYPIHLVNDFLDELEQQGVSVKRKIYPQQQHGFDYRVREFDTLSALIRRWSRPRRTTVSWNFLPAYPARPDNLLGWTLQQNQPTRCTAFWRTDTLEVSAEGVSEFEIISMFTGDKKIWVSRGDDISSASPLRRTKRLMLDKMIHFCFPQVSEQRCYRIDLK